MNLWWACRVGLDAQRTDASPPYDPDEFTALRLRCCLPRLPRAHVCWFATKLAALICAHDTIRLVEAQEWSRPPPAAVTECVREVHDHVRPRLPEDEAVVLSAWSSIVLGATSPAPDGEWPLLDSELMAGMIASHVMQTDLRSRIWPLYETALRTAYWGLPPHVPPPRKASHHRDLVDAYCQLPGRRGRRSGADWLVQRAMALGWMADEIAVHVGVPVRRIFAAIHGGQPDPGLVDIVAPCARRVPPSLIYPLEEAPQTWALMLRELAQVRVRDGGGPWLGELSTGLDDSPDV